METIKQRFHKKFNILHQKGLPSLEGMGDTLVKLEDYQQKLCSIARDKSKFDKVKGTITGKAFMEDLSYDLLIKHEINHLFLGKNTFKKYIEVNETYQKLIKFKLPGEEKWTKWFELLE